MFTGRVPFEADTYMGVLTQHMFVNPIPPSQVSSAARELGALEEITLRCLEKKPEDRFATMEDLVRAIDAVVHFENDGRVSVAPRLDDASPRHSRMPPRFKMADELEPPTLEEMRVASDVLPGTPRSSPWVWLALVAAVAVLGLGGIAFAMRSRESIAPAPLATSAPSTSNSARVFPPPNIPPPPPASAVATNNDPPDAAVMTKIDPKRPPPSPKAPTTVASQPTSPPPTPPRPKCDPDDPFCKH
jgi:hypothetical protein